MAPCIGGAGRGLVDNKVEGILQLVAKVRLGSQGSKLTVTSWL
jgi:hypothetical protein